MKKIKLTQGKIALADDEDYEKLNRYKWCAIKGRYTFYAQRSCISKGKANTIKMVHSILPPPPGMEIDHKDGNGCNNQRDNIRICNRSQNQANSSSYIGFSRHKGIHWCPKDKKWMSRIQVDGQRVYLGYFSSEKEAALVYNAAALKYFGEFARLNTINQVSREDLFTKLKELGI